MPDEFRVRRFAVLIDADNTSPRIAAGLFEEVAKFGEASVRRIYGDFSSSRLKSWADILQTYAIDPYQQFAYTTGKNASDKPLSKLVSFLYGAERGPQKATELEQQLKLFFESIIKLTKTGGQMPAADADIIRARTAIEGILRPVMARTERCDDPLVAPPEPTQPYEPERRDPPEAILAAADDILTFDDFVRRISSLGPQRRGLKAVALRQATALWLSVPYPVATLPVSYKAGRAVDRARQGGLRGDFHLRAPNPDFAPAKQPQAMHHPKLRGLIDRAPQLALPWLPPSLPWWPLGGAWADQKGASKSLVFAHFRAAPPAIAALASREVERKFGSSQVRWADVVKSPRKGFNDKHGGYHVSTAQQVLFHPWPCLVKAFDPVVAGRTRLQIHDAAVVAAHHLLTAHRGLKRGRKAAPLWQILGRLEDQDAGDEHTLAYDRATIQQIAQLMQGGPGVVVARSLFRYDRSVLDDVDKPSSKLLELTHGPLRTYLSHQYFQAACGLLQTRRRTHVAAKHGVLSPAHRALIAAVLDGNLESALDETIAVWLRIGAADLDDSLITQLKDVLRLHAGSLQVRPPDRRRGRPARLRSHVALALTGQETELHGEDAATRPEALRTAFNSPFWPHILTTTSIGQEGLDLHVWCREVVHWDPPPDALALEQREGRITRYAGLSVRQAMAGREGDAVLSACQGFASPWVRLMEAVDQRAKQNGGYTGLAPWWVYSDATIHRLSLAPEGSEQEVKLGWLRERLDLYRLALGQPHAFKEALADRLAGGQLSATQLRRFAVDLSAARLRRGPE